MAKAVIEDHGQLMRAIQALSDGPASEARGYLNQYFQTTGETEIVEYMKGISDVYIPKQYGWAAKLLIDGIDIQCYEGKNELHNKIKNAIWNVPQEEVEVVKKPVKKIHGGEIEKAIDDFIEDGCKKSSMTFDAYAYLEKNKPLPGEIRRIIKHFTDMKTELGEIDSDPELKEGYSYLGRRNRNNLISYLDDILNGCGNYISNTRVVNKTRTPAKKKKLAKVNYMASSDELQLVSLDPTKINGAKEVWIVHEKYNLLLVYRTADHDGLSLEGSSIKNFKENVSTNKKMLRKNLPTLGGLKKRAINKVWKDLSRKEYPNNGRLNKNHIIIGVF